VLRTSVPLAMQSSALKKTQRDSRICRGLDRGADLEKDLENDTTSQIRAFECDGCGESFSSWDRLRQHQVDCKSDDSDDSL